MTLYVCIQMIIDSQGLKMYLEHTIGLIKESIEHNCPTLSAYKAMSSLQKSTSSDNSLHLCHG
jgi:hypothetical protein